MNTSFLSLIFAILLVALVNVSTEPTVDLGKADDYVILSQTGITTVVPSVITGNIAVSPIAATAMTGFVFTMEGNGHSAKAPQISGKAYAASYGGGTPAKLTTAVSDMQAAYLDAKGRSNSDAARSNLGSSLGGAGPGGSSNPLTPGVYTFGAYITIGGDLHFNGMCSIACILLLFQTNLLTPLNHKNICVSLSPLFSGDGVYIIQVASYLSMTGGYSVVLENCASAEDIFWQVVGYVTIGAAAHMEGTILTPGAVTFVTGSTLNGRIYTQTNVALQTATITRSTATASANCECVCFLVIFSWQILQLH
jgi:hypothetical protein